jgi:hypothetical protein
MVMLVSDFHSSVFSGSSPDQVRDVRPVFRSYCTDISQWLGSSKMLKFTKVKIMYVCLELNHTTD